MITKEKIIVYQKMGGDIDHLERIGSKKEKKLMDGNTWSMIDGFIQDLGLIQKGLASLNFEREVLDRLEKETDCPQTIDEIKNLLDKYY